MHPATGTEGRSTLPRPFGTLARSWPLLLVGGLSTIVQGVLLKSVFGGFLAAVGLSTTLLLFVLWRKSERARQASNQKTSDLAETVQALEMELQCSQKAVQEFEVRLKEALNEANAADELTKHASHRFQELFAGLPVPCFTVDASGTIYDWNRSASDLFGRKPETVYLQNAIVLLPLDDDRARLMEAIMTAALGERVEKFEWKTLGAGDHVYEILSDAYPIRTPAGVVTGVLVSCVNQTDQKKASQLLCEQIRMIQDMNVLLEQQKQALEFANERLATLAATDGLTGTINHRTFHVAATDAFAMAQASHSALSIILLDVDSFKFFNDQYGHQTGDQTLRTVAQILIAACSPTELVARYGGEEFAVLCPGSDVEHAVERAEALRSKLQDYDWPLQPVTASFGVSTIEHETFHVTELVAQADQALYASKKAGKNRVSHFIEIKTKAA